MLQYRKILLFIPVIAILGEYRAEKRAYDEALYGSFDLQIKMQIAVWLALGAMAAYLIMKRRVSFPFRLGNPLLWYGAYVTLAAISILYTPVPSLALFRSGQLLTAIVLVAWFRPSLDDVLTFAVTLILMNWLAFFLFPVTAATSRFVEGEDVYRFCSVFAPSPNAIGAVAGIGATGVLASKLRKGQPHCSFYLALFLLLLATVVMSHSRSALIGTGLGILASAILSSRGHILMILWLALTVLIASSLFREKSQYAFTRGNIESVRNLTGRVYWWAEAYDRCWNRPLVGHGFLSTRVLRIGPMVSADSMILDSLLQLGVLGFSCLCFAFLALYARIMALDIFRSIRAKSLLAITCPVLTYCLTGTTLAGEVGVFILCVLGLWWTADNMRPFFVSHLRVTNREHNNFSIFSQTQAA